MRIIVLYILLFVGIGNSFSSQFMFSVSGYVTSTTDDEAIKNIPINIYPNVTDTTKKFTVYTNNEGFYHFTYFFNQISNGLITIEGFCDNNWTLYSEEVEIIEGNFRKDLRICHDINWHFKDIVIKGQVIDEKTNEPVSEHSVFITSFQTSNHSNTIKTDINGFYSDTFRVSILDSLKFTISTLTLCSTEPELKSIYINEPYCPEKIVNFEICTEEIVNWNVLFYHKKIDNNGNVYFYAVSDYELDSVHWRFDLVDFDYGYQVQRHFEIGSHKIEITAFKNGEVKKYSDIIVIGDTFSKSGMVYAGNVPLQNGYILAISDDKAPFVYSSYEKVTNGRFEFENILRGNYYLYAFPDFNIDTLYFPKYIGTYIDGFVNWHNSNSINISDEENSELVINLEVNNEVYYGNNFVRVNASEELLDLFDIANVVLFDSDNKPINSLVIKNSNGIVFKNLPDGNFTILIEIPGMQCKEFNFNLDNTKNNIAVDFYYNENKNLIDYYLLSSIENNTSDFNIFPNPFNDYLNIESDFYPCEIQIFDAQGSNVYTNLIKSKENINVNFLPKGIYLAVLLKGQDNICQKILIKN